MISYQYAYLLGDLLLGIVWLFLYLYRKDLERELIITSIVFGLCGPLSEILYLRDYWHPQLFGGYRISLEDFMFGFFLGGIASVIYKEVFHKYFSRKRDHSRHWIWFVPSFAIFSFLFLGFLTQSGVNSIYASMFLFGIVIFIMLFYRRDLFLEALGSGITIMLMILLAYTIFLQIFPEIFVRWWLLKNISGIFIFHIPIEELWWAFSFGAMAGPLYDFVTGRRIKN